MVLFLLLQQDLLKALTVSFFYHSKKNTRFIFVVLNQKDNIREIDGCFERWTQTNWNIKKLRSVWYVLGLVETKLFTEPSLLFFL